VLILAVPDLKIGSGEGWKHLTSVETETRAKVTSPSKGQHFWSYIQEESIMQSPFKSMLLFLFPPEYFLTGGLDQFLLHSASHTSQMQGRQ